MTEVAAQLAPFVLTTPLSAETLVAPEPRATSVRERLTAAVERVATVDTSIDEIHTRRFLGKSTPFQRRIIDSGRGTILASAGLAGAGVLGALVGLSAAMGTPVFSHWVPYVLTVGFAAAGAGVITTTVRENLRDRRRNDDEPLTTGDLAPTLELLRSMPQADRGLVVAHLNKWRAEQKKARKLTPAANEALMEAIAVDPKTHGPELRAARAATLIEDFRYVYSSEKLGAWRDKLAKLLSECPPEERAELAGELIARLFPGEKCLGIYVDADVADAIYRSLRKEQKTKNGES